MEAAEHADAALARNLNRVLAEHLRHEGGDARVLGMEPVRPDVEVEVTVVPRASQPADVVVGLEDGDVLAPSGQLMGEGQPGNAGTHDSDGRHRPVLCAWAAAGHRSRGSPAKLRRGQSRAVPDICAIEIFGSWIFLRGFAARL